MIAPSPIFTPGMMMLSRPIHTSFPMIVSPLCGSCAMYGRVFSVHALPKTLKGYVVALLMRWFAEPMMNFVPDAI